MKVPEKKIIWEIQVFTTEGPKKSTLVPQKVLWVFKYFLKDRPNSSFFKDHLILKLR